MKTIFSAFLFLLFVPGWVIAQQCDTTVIEADTAQFRALVNEHAGILLDVRTPEEVKTGQIADATNIDIRSSDFEQRIAELDTSATYYVYCESGRRSMTAAEYMLKQGFCRVIVLDYGLQVWRAAGYPLVIPGEK